MPAYVFNARPGDIAETVIMPGDPLRAKYIAESCLDDAREVTNVRNMLGFSGSYNGRAVSVIGHGIGIASAMLYTTELIRAWGVRRIIRVGSCGTVSAAVKLRDLVIAMGASTDSNVNRTRFRGHDLAAIADYDLLQAAVENARRQGLTYHVCNVFTSDFFYPPADAEMWDILERYRVPVVEMEIAGIYGVAAEYGAAAIALCTVSDDVHTHTGISQKERQEGFDDMIRVALETAAAPAP